jgi:hypothetical protein
VPAPELPLEPVAPAPLLPELAPPELEPPPLLAFSGPESPSPPCPFDVREVPQPEKTHAQA